MHLLHQAFAHPLILFALVALPVLSVLALLARRRKRRVLAQFGATGLRNALLAARGGPRWLRACCFSLGLSTLGLASAGPQWGRDWNETTAPGRDLVVVLDLSRSMQAEQPSRLVRAKDALQDLCDTLQQRGGHRIALVVFAGRAKVVCPLTHDYDHFRDALAALAEEPPVDLTPAEGESGTRIGLGLREAVAILDPNDQEYQDLLLLTDGDDPARDNEWQTGIRDAKDRAIPVHTVGIGDPGEASPIPTANGPLELDGAVVTTKLEEGPLRDIARLTGGVYVPAHTKALPLGKLFREQIEERAVRESEADALPLLRQRAPWFFAMAFGWLALEILLGGSLRLRFRGLRPATAPPSLERAR
jgi:Ca-activated chloride channel family protein